MNIENVKTVEELKEVLNFMKSIYPNPRIDFESDEKYSRKWWIEQFNINPELLLYAKDKDKNKICGIIFGWADGEYVTIADDKVLDEYKNTGLHIISVLSRPK